MHSIEILYKCSYASYFNFRGVLVYEHNKYPCNIKAGICAGDSESQRSIRVVGGRGTSAKHLITDMRIRK